MKAYKILTVSKDGTLWSMWDDHGHAIVYCANGGFRNTPNNGWGKLAAFDTKEHAIAHAKAFTRHEENRLNSPRVLYTCEVEPSKTVPELDLVFYRFGHPDGGLPMEYTPEGTIACDSITLLEKVPCPEVENT